MILRVGLYRVLVRKTEFEETNRDSYLHIFLLLEKDVYIHSSIWRLNFYQLKLTQNWKFFDDSL